MLRASSLSSKVKTKTKTRAKTPREYMRDASLTQKSYHNFINSLNSDVTKINYHNMLAPFLSKHEFSIKRTDEFLELPPREIEEMIINEIIDLQQNRKNCRYKFYNYWL